ncbi:NUDIX hydrolase [Chloroflexota bacterium]
MKKRLKRALSRRKKVRVVDARRVLAAVLVPIFIKQGEYHILFTRRTERVKDHKGQISFPGGVYEERDDSLLDTALRESREEVGLEAEAVEVLGELDDMPTLVTNYIITPFVAVIPWPYPFKLHPGEVDEIFGVPLSALLDRDCLRPETDPLNDGTITGDFYYYQGRIIWGASARILSQFLGIYVEAMEK